MVVGSGSRVGHVECCGQLSLGGPRDGCRDWANSSLTGRGDTDRVAIVSSIGGLGAGVAVAGVLDMASERLGGLERTGAYIARENHDWVDLTGRRSGVESESGAG